MYIFIKVLGFKEKMKGGVRMKGVVKMGALAVVVFLVLGCEGKKVKLAIDELTPKLAELEDMVINTDETISKAMRIANRLENEQIKKPQIDTVKVEIERIRTELTVLLALQGTVKDIQDSLAVLDKKATGDNKKLTTQLNERVNSVLLSIGKAKGCVCTIDLMKLKLEEIKKSSEKKGSKSKKRN